jgi:hypothetical protein
VPEVAAVDVLGGRVVPDPEETVRFWRAWHAGCPEGEGAGYVSVVSFDSRSGYSGVPVHARLDEMCGAVESDGLDALIWQVDEVGARRRRRVGGGEVRGPYNLFSNTGQLKRRPDHRRNRYARGCKRDMLWSPGCWADLDVGEGRFAGEGECLEALSSCGLEPSLVVATGSGGLHGYWRLRGGVDAEVAERMSERMIALLRAATGVRLDSVFNADRVMRLPGSVRWPKAREVAGALEDLRSGGEVRFAGGRLCRLVSVGGPEWGVEDVVRVTAGVWAGVQERREARERGERRLIADANLDLMEWLDERRRSGAGSGGGRGWWGDLYSVATAEELFAGRWSWEAVLEPHGWRLLGGDGAVDAQGRRTWTRPGGGGVGTNPRSLITDWRESPDVASLLSEAPETGLADLKESGVALTKLRVHVALEWGGDLRGFLRSWVGGGCGHRAEAWPDGCGCGGV